MEWERYEMEEGGDDFERKFYSKGPKGNILKAVSFQPQPELGYNVYNLMFGDYDIQSKKIDDRAISNNGDYKTILRTVAEFVAEFVNSHPRAFILIRGATPSRLRLYQMAISLAWSEISERYEVLGRQANKWSPFEKGVNYDEFLVFNKLF